LPDVTAVDPRWLDSLSEFDTWELARGGTPVREDAYSEPLPNYLNLARWSKLHLLRGVLGGDARPAASGVRHLARLILTNASYIGTANALALLGFERRAWERSWELGLPTDGWKPLSSEDQELIRIALKWDRDFRWSRLPSRAEFRAPELPLALGCATVVEGGLLRASLAALGGEPIPDLPPVDCNLGLARHQLEGFRLWSTTLFGVRHSSPEPGTPLLVRFGGWLTPFVLPGLDRSLQAQLMAPGCP
jgi:hypothetical protein